MNNAYKIEELPQGLLLFTINRPEKRNAINYDIMEGLEIVIERMKSDSLKALIITGEGEKAFCSGGDLSVFHELKTEEQAYNMLSKMSKILVELLLLPKPTIALINGTAMGGGCELAAACDFRFAKSGAKAGFVQGTLAITTGWGGGTILYEKIAASGAMKLLMEAQMHKAESLVELGFIDAVFEGDPLENCLDYYKNVFAIEAGVLEAYKSMLVRKWIQSGIKARIEEEVRTCARLWESDAHHAVVNSFLTRK
ncbi:MAG: enoyl-CoA hydratase/carnithine racemase [Bacillus sp. (in: firmicutes)]|jgi:enoyl-CoA hydratase/carnithine racemase|nr:enoyl-CoA hydratase/carnithine racemase [Bacillus sp. (in: firmicutes)]